MQKKVFFSGLAREGGGGLGTVTKQTNTLFSKKKKTNLNLIIYNEEKIIIINFFLLDCNLCTMYIVFSGKIVKSF